PLYAGQRATGDVLLDGEDILAPTVDVAGLRYRGGMVFQKGTPFAMTIFDNVAFGLRLPPPGPPAERRGLPGGQQQRLCIARPLAVRPEVILFDEPTAALDPISTLRVEETLQSLRESYCIAI